jgi:hypothetical protein
MNLLRSKVFCRAVVGLAVVCLVGMTVGPSYAHRATYTSYGEWLRSQIQGAYGQGSADDTFDRALASATSGRVTSIEEFLHAFVDSWNAEGDLDDLAAIFGIDGIDGSLLVSYLQSRFSGLTPDALPSRTLLIVPAVNSASGSDRSMDVAHSSASAARVASGSACENFKSAAHSVVDARRLLTSMPRLGP